MNWGDHHLRSIWNGFSFSRRLLNRCIVLLYRCARSSDAYFKHDLTDLSKAGLDRFKFSWDGHSAFCRCWQHFWSHLYRSTGCLFTEKPRWSRASWFKSVYLANLFDLGTAFSNNRSALTCRYDQAERNRRNCCAGLFQILDERTYRILRMFFVRKRSRCLHLRIFGRSYRRLSTGFRSFRPWWQCVRASCHHWCWYEHRSRDEAVDDATSCCLSFHTHFFSNGFDIITTFTNDTANFLSWRQTMCACRWLQRKETITYFPLHQ